MKSRTPDHRPSRPSSILAPSLAIWMGLGLATTAGCSTTPATSDPGDAPGTGGGKATGGKTGGGSGGSNASGGSSGSGGSASGGGSGAAGSGGGAGSGGAPGGSGGSPGGSGGTSSDDAAAPGGGDAGANPGTPGKPSYAKILKLDTTPAGANITGDVAKYPVAVMLTATNFDFTQANAKGADIRFATMEGAALPHAIEFWDATAKLAAIWVKVDVKGNSATNIKMTWGDSAAADASDSHAVFDTKDGFVGVWHLSEAAGTTAGAYKDATANAADATGIAMEADSTAAGRVGKATSLVHAKKQYIQIDGDKNKLFDIYDKMTYSIWVQQKSHTVEYQCMFSKGEGGFRIHFYGAADWGENKGKHISEICVEAAGDLCAVNPGGGTDVAPNKWLHLVGVHDHPKMSYYVNGVLEKSLSDNGAWKSDATKPVQIGANSSSQTRSFDGLLDEARIMGVPKDLNWVKLEFESQKEGQKFVTFGETMKL
jgi:hypothetical protein